MDDMQQKTSWSGTERKRVEAVVQTLATSRGPGENLSELAHDARNMVTALGLYCDLLEEPGVLAKPYHHYGNELRLVTAASRRLVEKLVSLDAQDRCPPLERRGQNADARWPVTGAPLQRDRVASRFEAMPTMPIDNLAAELLANGNLLAALAGPTIKVNVTAAGGAVPVQLLSEDLTRILVNLVKNAAEAMPAGGTIDLCLRETTPRPGSAGVLSLVVEDTGPGISDGVMERIFEAGFSTRTSAPSDSGWPAAHRGLGLSITRSVVEAAGGRIDAANAEQGGARFTIELPMRAR